jgi:hypothetical protein
MKQDSLLSFGIAPCYRITDHPESFLPVIDIIALSNIEAFVKGI